MVVNYKRGRMRDRIPAEPEGRYAPSRDHHYQNSRMRSYASAVQFGNRDNRGNSSRNRNFQQKGYQPKQFFVPRIRIESTSASRRKYMNTPTNHTDRNNVKKRGKMNPIKHNNNNPAKEKQSDDPDFGNKVRGIHKIIKITHHLNNVSSKQEPPTITRITHSLTNTIKPAVPNPNTQALIEGNAKNWAHTTMLILRDHYSDALESEMDNLNKMPSQEWQRPFEVATSWAKRNLGRRLKTITIEQVEALLLVRMTADQNDQPSQTRTNERTPQESITNEGVMQPKDKQITITAQIHTTRTQATTVATTNTGTMTDKPTDSLPEKNEEEEELFDPLAPLLMPPPGTGPKKASPKPQRQKTARKGTHTPRTPPKNPCVVNTPDCILNLSMEGLSTDTRTDRQKSPLKTPPRNPGVVNTQDPILDLSMEELEEALQEQEPIRKQRILTPLKLNPSKVTTLKRATQTQLYLTKKDMTNITPDPETPTLRPTRHLNTRRKMVDWALSVRKKWLILGDSNVARFPPYIVPDLQIDGYPGATLRHAEAVISKATCHTIVEKVILSVGLNNRSQIIQKTSVKQLQAAIRAAKKKFPQAEVWIPEINYSRDLPLQEQGRLRALNAHIVSKCHYIPALPREAFETEPDRIHWTKDTAWQILEHWCDQTN